MTTQYGILRPYIPDIAEIGVCVSYIRMPISSVFSSSSLSFLSTFFIIKRIHPQMLSLRRVLLIG